MAAMTDAEKLREALEEAKASIKPVSACSQLVRTGIYTHHLEALIDAAEAHLSTLPKTKMVEVWRLEYAQMRPKGWQGEAEHWPTKAEAEERMARLNAYQGMACFRVTGPFQQEVPL